MSLIKIISVIFILFVSFYSPAFCEGDLWDNYGDQNFYGTEGAVSDEDFDKAIDSKKGGKKPKKMKGESIQQSNETDVINQLPKELPVICMSVPVKVGENAVLPVGHYQVASEKRGDKIYLKLYQGYDLMAEFEAVETLDDFEQPEVHFVDLITGKDNRLKIIYGSIDYNAYVNLEPAGEQ